ncbi:lipopolysaccharide biosynthesis protein [Petrotoga sp. 9PWA.NaAc.5.4]|uniref:lipopolysaccharide biosynthesis protein n=1 Tax=Petrotoga sp. 9PWA.NaAc.5.4 TaxID=1434328 RepID=UPI000CC91D53|nr:oligosaccharide flippase family protein [Petrotoga sp. 9PWA.NaAc.5.4]PNR93207.1 polysaccharide biosynthesis protein [Petrotoga sp. 9PWA.NaAc.5.4]
MNKERNFIKSFFQFSIGQWIAALISFVTTPITTWLIIPEEFGKASMFTLAFNLFLNISLLGTDQSFVRMFYEKPEEDRRNLLWESLMPGLSVGFIVFVIIGLFWKELSFVLFEDSNHFLSIFLLGLTILIGCVERFATLVVRMKQRGIAFSTLRVVNGISNAVFTILYALLVSRTFYAIIVGLFLSHIVSATLAIFLERDLWFGKFKVNFDSVKEIIKYGLPFVPTFLIIWIFQSFDKLALRNYATFTEIGLYSAAFKVVAIMNLIQTGFTTFWTPVSYESYENNPESTGLFEKVSLFISAAMFVVGMLIIVFKDVIFLLLAKSYRSAAQIAPFLILMPIMYTTSEVSVVGINFKKKTFWHMLIATVAAGCNIVGNTLLVPLYGAKGAAFATGISYIIFFIMRTFISKYLYPVNYHLGKFFTATIVFVIVAFINTFIGNLVWQVLSAVVGLVIVLLVYNTEVKYVLDLVVDELKRVKNKVTNRV